MWSTDRPTERCKTIICPSFLKEDIKIILPKHEFNPQLHECYMIHDSFGRRNEDKGLVTKTTSTVFNF